MIVLRPYRIRARLLMRPKRKDDRSDDLSASGTSSAGTGADELALLLCLRGHHASSFRTGGWISRGVDCDTGESCWSTELRGAISNHSQGKCIRAQRSAGPGNRTFWCPANSTPKCQVDGGPGRSLNHPRL